MRGAPSRSPTAALALAIAAFAASTPAAAQELGGADSTRFTFEAGIGGDVSNHVFYEQSFDSTLLGERVEVSDPETRFTGVALVRLVGVRGRTTFQVWNEARAGDDLLRNLARLGIAHATGARSAVSLDLEADGRHDRSFGLDRRDLRLSGVAAARAASADRMAGGRLFARAERVRGREEGDGLRLYPDFDFVQAGLDADRIGERWGAASLSYAFGARTFPDSTARDHVEHTVLGSGLLRLDERWAVDVFGDAGRRVAHDDLAFGDRLWQGDVEGRLVRRVGERWELGARSRTRFARYDEPTPTFFDASVHRHALFARVRLESGLEFEVRPTVELARTPDFGGLPADASTEDKRAVAGEEYDELGFAGEIERFGQGGWWSVSPAFGRRDYLKAAASAEDLSSRSDFWFGELTAFADLRLTGRLLLRATADFRLEDHDVAADDAKSLSVAAELRVPLM